MKTDDVKNALYEAFEKYWQEAEEISINGESVHKYQYKQLVFIEKCFELLKEVICCDADPLPIEGSIEAYIPAQEPNDRKNTFLKFVISRDAYTCSKNVEGKPYIEIKDVKFQKR